MEDRRGNTNSTEEPHTADAQNDLLADACPLVAPVHVRGQIAEAPIVLRQIGVQKIDRGAPDPDSPSLEIHFAVPDFYSTDNRVSLLVSHQRDRQSRGIIRRIAFDLPSLGRNLLLEIALAVEQRNADKREAEVAGRFCMVAGEDAQTTRVDPETFVQAEF